MVVAFDVAVVGLGHVGMPLAREAVNVGLRVLGYDVSSTVVSGINGGQSHVDDVSDDDIGAMLASGFIASSDEGALQEARIKIICVSTPLSAERNPDLTALKDAAEKVGRTLQAGDMVVLESTTYPGTTADVLCPILEAKSGLAAGIDFALGYSPERIDPGNPDFTLRNTPKVVSGYTTECGERVASFYSKLVDRVVMAKGTHEAELAKLLENIYRQVNIALVNELAMVCHGLGVDVWDAIGCAATKPFGFQMFRPGPGVGGHCIPVDPTYLTHILRSAGRPFRLAELAQEINDRMPSYVVERIYMLLNSRGKPLMGSQLLLLGVAYKENVSDQRGSPANAIARQLRLMGAHLAYHDPYIAEWIVDDEPVEFVSDVDEAISEADLTVVLQPHSWYDLDQIAARAPLLFDTAGRARGR